MALSGTIYCDLGKTASGDGSEGNAYTPAQLSALLNAETTLTGDVTIKLQGNLIINDGSQLDLSTPNLTVDNGFKITFEKNGNQANFPPKIYSISGGYSTRSLVKISGGSADVYFTDVLVHVRGDLNQILESCIEVIGSNNTIVANCGAVGNDLYNLKSGSFCNPGVCNPGCGVESGFVPIFTTNFSTSVYSCTKVVHTRSEELLDTPGQVVRFLRYANCQVVLGNVAYSYFVEANDQTSAEANNFFKVEGTNVSVISIYKDPPVLTPVGQPDVGDFTDSDGLVNVIGDFSSLNLSYDPVEGVGKGLANISNTTAFDASYPLFSTFTNSDGNAGYDFTLRAGSRSGDNNSPLDHIGMGQASIHTPGGNPLSDDAKFGGDGSDPNDRVNPTDENVTNFGFGRLRNQWNNLLSIFRGRSNRSQNQEF